MLKSFRDQLNSEVELIVVDGASTDGTLDIIQNNSDLISRAVSEPDCGIYDAWNKGVAMSRGRFVAFIGADDLMASGAIQALLDAIDEVADEVLIIAGFNVSTRSGIPVSLIRSSYTPQSIQYKMTVAQLLSAHRKDWLVSVGGFKAAYRSSGDYELFLRERNRLNVKIIPKVLTYMETGGTSVRGLTPAFEDLKARLENGVPKILCFALLIKALIGYPLRVSALRNPN